MALFRLIGLAPGFLMVAAAAAEPALETDEQIYSYGIGLQVGQSLKNRDVSIDRAALIQAIEDALAGREPRVPLERLQAVFEKRQQQAQEQRSQSAAENATASKAFLDKNRGQDGVVETDSGLQYHIINRGDGQRPGPEDVVTVHYRGTLLSGQEFDSSYQRGEPATFPLQGVIPGWQEALALMPVGSKWRVFVPPELAYGEQGAGNAIGPNQALVFEIELLSIN